jgi:prevent-host-death family protein
VLIWPNVAMKRVRITELKNNLSAHLRAVERGAEVEVTDRDRAIVRLVPVSVVSAPTIIPALRPFREVRTKRFAPAGWRIDSAELLREERGRR